MTPGNLLRIKESNLYKNGIIMLIRLCTYFQICFRLDNLDVVKYYILFTIVLCNKHSKHGEIQL